MEIKDFSITLGIMLTVLWLLKVIVTKLIDKFFKQAEQLDEARDDALNAKINRISADMSALSIALKNSSEESVRLKITLHGLSKTLEELKSDMKASGANNKETIVKLIDVLKNMQAQIKVHGQELETFGKILMKMPEVK
jgi:chromosome segregation ATPase